MQSPVDLKLLPLRGIVLYSVRWARRVRPLYKLPSIEPRREKHLASLDEALEDASCSSTLCDGQLTDLRSQLRLHADHCHLLSHGSRSRAAEFVATAVAQACSAAEASISNRPESTMRLAKSAVESALEAAAYKSVLRPLQVAAKSDYSDLIAISRGRFPELGAPIELGTLWPEGQPNWWREENVTLSVTEVRD